MRAKYLAAAVATLLGAGAVCGTWMSMHETSGSTGSSQGPVALAAASEASPAELERADGRRTLPVRQWKAGDTFVYDVDTVRGASVEGLSQTAQKVEVRLAGTLALTVTGRDPSGVLLRGELRSPRHVQIPRPEQDCSASLARPFYLTILPTGEMTSFSFAKDVPPEVRILLKGLTSSLQLVAPSLPLEGWRMTEQDVSGEYEAAYRMSAGVVHKTKVKYLRARGPKGLIPLPSDSVYSVKSAVDFDIDRTGWPRTVAEQESLDVTMREARVLGSIRTTAKLASLESHPELAGGMRGAEFESDALSDAAASALAKKQADKGLVDGKTFKELGIELGSPDLHLRNRTQARMAALFRVEPERAREAGDEVLHGKSDENAKKRLLGALGNAATPEAQHALASVLGATDAPRGMRTDAAAALGLTRQPTPEGEEALVKAMESSDKAVADTATLALGNQVHTMNTEESGDTRGPVEKLIDLLQRAGDDNQRAFYLQALGNTGDLRALPAILPYLTHADTTLRAIATASLRFMIGGEVDALVIVAMADKDATVRTAAVGTIPFRPVAGVLSAVEALLHSEPEVTVRLAIVNALNMKRSEDPAVGVVLAWAAEEDPAEAVKTLAQQVLGKQP